MLRLTDPYRLYYSALRSGLLLSFPICLGLALFAVQGVAPCGGVWFVVLLIPLAGLVLESASRRVIYIRGYQFIISSLIGLVHGTLLWTVLALDRSYDFKLFAGLVTAGMFVALAVGAYRINQRRYQHTPMPCGPVGVLDKKTGLVDPTLSPPNIQRQQDRLEKLSVLLWRLAPLTAGLVILLVHGLPASADEVLVAIVAFTFAALGAGGAGGLYFFLVTSKYWEQQHGKLIYVKR